MKIAIVEDNKILAILLKEKLESYFDNEIKIDLFFDFNDFIKNCNVYDYKFYIIDIILTESYNTGIDIVTFIKNIYKEPFGVYLTSCLDNTSFYIRAYKDVRDGYIYEIIIKTEDIQSILKKIVYYIKITKDRVNGTRN